MNVSDDDQAPSQTTGMPTITILDSSALEGDPVTFTVYVTPALTSAVTLSYETVDGSAIAHSDVDDYTAASGMVTITANATSATFTVDTTEDTDIEIDDEFTVELSGAPTGTMFGDKIATGSINNDDIGAEDRRAAGPSRSPCAHPGDERRQLPSQGPPPGCGGGGVASPDRSAAG